MTNDGTPAASPAVVPTTETAGVLPPTATGEFLVLNAEDYPLAVLLGPRDAIPPAAVLDRKRDLKWAGRSATEVVLGKRVVTSAAGQPVTQVVVRRDTAQLDPAEVMHYDQRRQGQHYLHRFLCGNYPNCSQPDSPWMFYCPPSKNPDRDGRQICGPCRRRNPSPRTRKALADMNRARAKRTPA